MVARALMGTHIASQKPIYANTKQVMQDHGTTYADTKYDGYRVQIHSTGDGGIWMFTNNGNRLNKACYPDLVSIAKKFPKGIFEAEMIGPGKTHKERYDNTKKRFRRQGISEESVQKYLASGIVRELPMEFKVFDVLRWEDRNIMKTGYQNRRKHVEKLDIKGAEPAETRIITTKEDLDAIVRNVIAANEEGIVCKRPMSIYKPGSRTLDWVKFKRGETLDLAIVGFYKNEKQSSELPVTGALCATYNEETGLYETIGKIGLVRDNIGEEVYELCGEYITNVRAPTVVFSEALDNAGVAAKNEPDMYIDPQHAPVLEVKAMNIDKTRNWQSCGYDGEKAYSMRIAFAEQIREDKDARHATTTESIAQLYALEQEARK